ncbi:MAG: hypothetical protein ACRCWG_16920 [Sarcina sp.]
MNKLFSLIKYSIKNSLGGNKGKKNLNNIGLYVLVAVPLIIGIFYMVSTVMNSFKQMGLPDEFIFVIAFMMAMGGIFVTDVLKSAGAIFNVKDFQLLASLPVSSGTIILAKITEMLLINYVFVLGATVPALCIYFTTNEFNIALFLMIIIAMIFVPLIPMSIAILLGYIIYKLSSKFKFKEIAITALYIIGMTVFLGVFYTAQFWMQDILEKAPYVVDIISKIYLPLQFYMNMVIKTSWIDLIYFVGSSLAIFTVFMMIIKNTFFVLNSRFIVFGKSNETKIKDGVIQSKVKSLLKMELLKYFSKGGVVINTIAGGLIYVIFSVLGGMEILPIDSNIVVVIGCIFFAMSPVTATCISLEGKAFNMKKALPIKVSDVIKSKILLNIVVNLPFVILGTIINIVLQGDIKSSLIGLVGILCALLFASIFGLLMDMKFYNFNWVSEMEVVKRGKAVIFTTIPNMVIMFVLMGIKIPGVNTGLIAAGVYGVAAIVAGIVLIKHGEELYNKIGEN